MAPTTLTVATDVTSDVTSNVLYFGTTDTSSTASTITVTKYSPVPKYPPDQYLELTTTATVGSANTGDWLWDPVHTGTISSWDTSSTTNVMLWQPEQPGAPAIIVDAKEKRARELLQHMLGPKAYKRYIRKGLVRVKGKSGRTYHVYPGSKMVEVFDNGKLVERLCIMFRDFGMPPTDYVIMRKAMIESAEEEFLKTAIKHPVAA